LLPESSPEEMRSTTTLLPGSSLEEAAVEGPYNKYSTVKTLGSSEVYGKFHAHV
jgi:hypothetical protein